MDAIREAGYDITTPVLVSNTGDYLDILAKRRDCRGAADHRFKIIDQPPKTSDPQIMACLHVKERIG